MAYFNHAFKKSFLATGVTVSDFDITLVDGSAVTVDTDGGYLLTAGVPTYGLNLISQAVETGIFGSPLTSGYIGFFNPRTNASVDLAALEQECCPLYLAGSAIYSRDKIGPFAGGYTETNKSKVINPRYVSRFYTVAPCAPQNEVLHVGSTYWTAGGGIDSVAVNAGGTTYTDGDILPLTGSVAGTGALVQVTCAVSPGPVTGVTLIAPGKGYDVAESPLTIDGGTGDATIDITVTQANTDPVTGSGGESCCKPFLCGETYNLRLDIKGSPALRYLNHNAYYTASFYTGCCPDSPDDPQIAPVPVDSTLVMIGWADLILRSPIVNPFVEIVIQDQEGVLWYAPGTSAAFLAQVGGDTWNNYVSPGYIEGACAGMILNGAYVDTRFGDCTFQISDFYEKEPVRLYVSEMDLNGDPCTFDGICVVHECFGRQVNGLGETVLRDMILSESYRQNFVATDLRIREITQGNQIISSVDRGALYWRYYLQHNVPRHNNPTGTFDADQYLLEVFALNPIFGTNPLPAFTEGVGGWLANCGVCEIEPITCVTDCDSIIRFPSEPLPVQPILV
jgi:hypothetical protein